MAGLAVKLSVFFVIIFFIYKAYKFYIYKNEGNKPIELIGSEQSFTENYVRKIPRIDLPEPNVNLTLNWKMKIYNIPSNYLYHSSNTIGKPIILNDGCPNVYYEPQNNVLRTQFQILNALGEVVLTDIRIPNVPIQKWLMISIVIRGRNINIFFDGKLKRSFRLSNIPLMPKGHLQFGSRDNNFLGKVKDAVYYPVPLRVDEIQNLL